MFKKFNWGLTRPFLFRWPVTGFSSVRTDYGLIVKANSVIVKVLESVFFKRFKLFNKTITLSHILLKHINVPKYISVKSLNIAEYNPVIKKNKFKNKFKTKKFKPKKRHIKSFSFLNLAQQKTNKIIVEIFYNYFSRKFKPKKVKKFKKIKFKITKKQKKIKKLKKLKKQQLIFKNILKISKLKGYTTRYTKRITRYFRNKKKKRYYNKPVIRSQYLFKMARIAFSYYDKKVSRPKPVKIFTFKIIEFLKFKIKKFKKRLSYKYTNFKRVKIIKLRYLISRSLRKLYWKSFANRLSRSFSRFNLNVFPVFREINILSGNASFYGNYLVKRLRASKRPQIFQAVNPLIRQLKKSTNILAVKIKFKGRFTRNQRATKKNIGFGSLPYGSISQNVDYSIRIFNAKFGSTSIKLLIKFAK